MAKGQPNDVIVDQEQPRIEPEKGDSIRGVLREIWITGTADWFRVIIDNRDPAVFTKPPDRVIHIKCAGAHVTSMMMQDKEVSVFKRPNETGESVLRAYILTGADREYVTICTSHGNNGAVRVASDADMAVNDEAWDGKNLMKFELALVREGRRDVTDYKEDPHRQGVYRH